ncbi:DUF2913 family protein [Shewanella vesiculosa]|uniref:DUF2913 family protein n=1 Tax=Shewanella vesiculosa TaxID=518738 RepID=A0ABV0FU92_9GAMM
MTQYYETLKDVCENALLNMYLEVSSNNRFTPIEKRTQIIKKFIKPKLKMSKYKVIKPELKRLALVKATISLESELHKLLTNMLEYKRKGDAEALLFDFLGNIHVWTGLMIQVANKFTVAEPGNVYLLEDETFSKLDKDGHYIKPINLFVYLDTDNDLNTVLSQIQQDERFNISVSERFDTHAKLNVLPVNELQ